MQKRVIDDSCARVLCKIHRSVPPKKVLLMIMLTLFSLQIFAKGMAQPITMKENNISIEKVFELIEKKYGYHFVYTSSVMKNETLASVNFVNASLSAVLDEIFESQPISYSIIDNVVVIKQKATASEIIQSKVRGIVEDEDGYPLGDVTVMVKGTVLGVKTNEKGEFELDNIEKGTILVFSSVNYVLQEVPVGNSSYLKVVMIKYDAAMETVIVNTGYQKLPKERITGAINIVGAKALEKKPQLNVLERLEGMVPGLLIINGKDNGRDDALTIRGVSTLYGTKRPLIVVDNFPIEGNINSINPNDVLSITVLKDAAAASIWGARAANGVIVITTKNGTVGKPLFSYRNSFQFSNKPDLSKMGRLSAAEDIGIERKLLTPSYYNSVINNDATMNAFTALYFDSLNNKITPQQYAEGIDRLGKLDNAQQISDYLMQRPFTQSHSLAVNGGSDRNQYYGSLIYTGSNGYALKEKNEALSVFLKNNMNITKRLSLGVNFNYTNSFNTESPVDPLTVFRLKPYAMLKDESGREIPLNTSGDPNGQNTSNAYSIQQRLRWGLLDENYYPIQELDRRKINFNSNFIRVQGLLTYKIMSGLDATISYQHENTNNIQSDLTQRNSSIAAKLINDFITPKRDAANNIITNADGTMASPTFNIPLGAIKSESRASYVSYTLRGVLNFDKTFNDLHNVSAVAGGEQRGVKMSSNNLTRYGYDDNTLQSIGVDEQRIKSVPGVLRKINSGYTVPGNYFRYNEDRFISVFANAAYSFSRKYVLSGSMRMDATNLFGTDPKYRYKPMWSLGASWVLSNESFMKTDLINNLTLRGTYGINGNIPKETGPFMLAVASTNPFSNFPSNNIYSPGNNQLSWEPTMVTNIGLDFSIARRVEGKLDWYRRNSNSLLSDFAINPTHGFQTLKVNAGSMTNNGVELELTTRNIQKNDFEWRTTFMYSINKNKITKVTTSDNYNTAYYRASYSPGGVFVEGYPYGSLFSFRYAGLSPDQGQILLYDQRDSIYTGNYYGGMLDNLNALVFTGNTRPNHTASFGNNFRYKNLELSFLFVYYGSYFMKRSIPSGSRGSVNALNNSIAGYWQKPGDEKNTTVPSLFTNADYSSYYNMIYFRNLLDINVFNASYIKLRDVSIAYNFNKSLLQKTGYIKGLQITAQGRNLWTHVRNKYGYDPESFSGGYPGVPIMPTYILGVNVDF